MGVYNSPSLRGVNVDYAFFIRIISADAYYFISMLPRLHVKTLRVHSTLRGLWLGFHAPEKNDARTVLKHMTLLETEYPVFEVQHKADLSMRLMETMPEIECVYRFEHEAFAQCISKKSSVWIAREFSHVIIHPGELADFDATTKETTNASLQPLEPEPQAPSDRDGA